MKVIVITLPIEVENEAALIEQMLELGVYRVHIRKPSWSYAKVRDLVAAIDEKYRERLTLNDYFELCEEFNIGGIEINDRNPNVPDLFTGVVSNSCHTFEEVDNFLECINLCNNIEDIDDSCWLMNYESYVTLSPIFDSISKSDYALSFTDKQLREASAKGIINNNVIAMGGITPKDFCYLHTLGFGGVALMEYIWEGSDILNRVQQVVRLAKLYTNISLQFITHINSKLDDIYAVKQTIDGGCRWIELRMRDASDDELISFAEQIREECNAVDASFLIKNKVHLFRECKADGVHLGRNNMAPSKARGILGKEAIIGGTANSLEDIDYLVAEGVDYISLCSFRFTITKDNLAPILGLDGYKKAIEYCKSKGYSTPIIASGGITESDIPRIMRCGVNGVALSGSILNASDSRESTKKIINIIAKSGNK